MELPVAKPPDRSWPGLILSSTVLCLGAVIGAPFMVAAVTEVNLRIYPDIPWFLIPAVGITLVTLLLSERWFKRRMPEPPRSYFRLVATCVLISVGLAAVALVFMFGALSRGHLILPGDKSAAPELFRVAKSFSALLSAAVIEESAFRGALQLRLQSVLRPRQAEWVAGLAFVLAHFARFSDPGEFPLLVLMAFANSRIATMTQSVRYPALIHLLANGIICSAVLYLRR